MFLVHLVHCGTKVVSTACEVFSVNGLPSVLLLHSSHWEGCTVLLATCEARNLASILLSVSGIYQSTSHRDWFPTIAILLQGC